MKFHSVIFVLFLTDCIIIGLAAPLSQNQTLENVESSSATEIVFDDSATEIATSDNLEATTPQSESDDGESTQSDDIPPTTASPSACGNDIDSPADCPAEEDFVTVDGDKPLSLSSKTDDIGVEVPVLADSEDVAEEERATTVQP